MSAIEPLGPELVNTTTIGRAYYIKLGAGGLWAEDSIANGLLRFGWGNIPLPAMLAEDWATIRSLLAVEHHHKGTVTADTERLRDILGSTIDDVWITFHDSHRWWCRLADNPVSEDTISRFRRVDGRWSASDIVGRPLLVAQIPGRIAQLQGFRGTVCSVRESLVLGRLLRGETSPEFDRVTTNRAVLAGSVASALQQLHWKDFETLVDLLFRQAGWRRRSVLGESMKFVDLELEEPITRDAYQVQVKSRADIADLEKYAIQFSGRGFRKLYFVVHSPTAALRNASVADTDVELILPERLGELVVDHGLVPWLLDKIR